MIIGGFQKFSLIDYPNNICAIIFTRGCNFRCPYCYNPELVDPKRFRQPISNSIIFSFLEKRKGKIDAVEITGGEPTLQKDLVEFIEKIKNMGYLVKLDTNGSNPNIVEKIISRNYVDYIAMDVKAPLQKYQEITGINIDTKEIENSINLIINSGIDYEFRTTLVKSLLSKEDIIDIAKILKGAKRYILQRFVPTKGLVGTVSDRFLLSIEKIKSLKERLENYVNECVIR